jgi:BirA family biotin operon repressor/biotin-[acetyl-CoA-carboxylase] ligase
VSRTGNLHASTLVWLRPGDPPAPSLALVAGVAMHEALSVFAPVPLVIKWPNDVLAGGAKIAGTLLERRDDAVVVGIGANLAYAPDLPDRPATSLAAVGGASPDAGTTLDVLAEAFARRLAEWRDAGLAATIAAWTVRAHPIGSALTASPPDGPALTGLFDGLNEDGALRLRLADGRTHVIHAADILVHRS